MNSLPNCDCGATDETDHLDDCIRNAAHEANDIADEVSLADTGRPWGARVIKHPSHAATRAHLAEHPMPGQRKAGAA